MVRFKPALVAAVGLLIVACGLAGPPPASLVLPTSTALPTATPALPPTFTPALSPTLLPTTPALPPTPTPVPSPTPLPTATSKAVDLPQDALLVYEKSGCFDGRDDTLTVRLDGRLELVNNRRGTAQAAQASPDQLGLLRDLLAQPEFTDTQALYQAMGADLCVYSLTMRAADGQSRTVTTMDTAQHPPILQQVIHELDGLVAWVKAGGPTPQPRPVPSLTSSSISMAAPTPTAGLPPTARPSPTPTAAPANRVALRLVADLATGGDNLAFSPDDALLAVGTFTGTVWVWDTATWTQRWEGAHADGIRKIAFSPDGRRLASVSFDHTARLWDVASGDQVARLDYGYWVYGLDFTADGRQWASGSFDGRLILADTATGKIVREFKQDLLVYDLALSPAGPPWLAAATTGSWGPGRVVVWDTVTGENRLLAEFQVPGYSSNVAFSPDNRWLAAGLGNTAQVVVWQTLIWPEVARLTTPAGIVNRVLFSPEGGRLAAVVNNGEQDNSLVVWDVPSWQVVSTMKLPDQAWSAAFSPDGQWLVVGLGQGTDHPPAFEGELWDINSGTLAARMPHSGQVLAVAFSHDGRRIATGSNDAVKVWDLP
jgi:WD40 repeat protein